MKKAVLGALVLSLLLCSGCGTLFFSHRLGKKMSNRIDKRVFITNCILCLCGIIPGVVAFVLDYDNGSIYYTEAELIPDEDIYGMKLPQKMKTIPCREMSAEAIAAELSAALGREVSPFQVRLALAGRGR